jgi:hypothetical protein
MLRLSWQVTNHFARRVLPCRFCKSRNRICKKQNRVRLSCSRARRFIRSHHRCSQVPVSMYILLVQGSYCAGSVRVGGGTSNLNPDVAAWLKASLRLLSTTEGWAAECDSGAMCRPLQASTLVSASEGSAAEGAFTGKFTGQSSVDPEVPQWQPPSQVRSGRVYWNHHSHGPYLT